VVDLLRAGQFLTAGVCRSHLPTLARQDGRAQ
jgi:hypothetical protein